MERPSDSLKHISNTLAQELSTQAGMRLARLLRTLPSPELPSMSHDGAKTAPDGQRVGIWERVSSSGESAFVRDKNAWKDWHLWANAGRIPAKGSARRIVLLGESVARGYLYDPAYNPASVLTKVLESVVGQGAVEVVDLARTSLGMDIEEVALAAAALEPDAVVLFCGNNWHYDSPQNPLEAGALAAAVRERGAAGYKEHAESVLRVRARQLVKDISTFYADRGVPLLWIAPEFNLGDWRDPVANAPHLPGEGNRVWLSHRRAAQSALAAGDYAAATEAARHMVELDQGAGAAGHYVLARCAQAAGDLERSRSALESARDASVWDTALLYAPRSTAPVLSALREGAQAQGDLLVDSPKLFQEHLKGELPDRRLFLDYCHLTSEGIRVTMAATASALLGLFDAPATRWQDLLPEAPRPGAKAEAEAHFLAAVHNAHWWQEGHLVEHYLAESVSHSAHVVPVISAFLEQQARRAPMMMGRSAETIFQSGSTQIQQYLFGGDHRCLDALIAEAAARHLPASGDASGARTDRLWIEEHGTERQPVDLLDYYFLSAARQPHETEWVRPGMPSRGRHYYKAFSPTSTFCFIGEADHPVILDVTWRLPHPAPATAEVCVYVNDQPVGKMAGGAAWERHEITVSADLVRDGLNEVALEWPSPRFPGSEAIETFSDDVMSGRTPDPYCAFGNVHAFTARSGRAG